MVQERLIRMVNTGLLRTAFKENIMKKVPVPMEMDSSEFYNNDVSTHGGANFDGNQKNGRHGSPMLSNTSGEDANTDYNGINFNNNQDGINNAHGPDMIWEKTHGVFMDPTKKFTDIHDKMFKEVDLRPIIEVPGMPSPNCNHNTHDDTY